MRACEAVDGVAGARVRAKRERLVLVANLAVLVPGMAWIAALVMDWEHASSLLFAAIGTLVLARCIELFVRAVNSARCTSRAPIR